METYLRSRPVHELTRYEKMMIWGQLCDNCQTHSHGPMSGSASGMIYCERCASGVSCQPPVVSLQIPAEYTFADLSQYSPGVQKMTKDWPGKIRLAAIAGCPGSGKTNLCWAIAKRMAEEGKQVQVIRAADLADRWRVEMNGAKREVVDKVIAHPFLALDDLHQVTISPGWVEAVYRILDHRVTEHRPTLLTLSGPVAGLAQAYGQALVSRLGQFRLIPLPNVDRRARQNRVSSQPGPGFQVKGPQHRLEA